MRPASPQARVDLRDRERLSAARQHLEDGTSGTRQAQASTHQEVRQCLSNGGGGPKVHTLLTCILDRSRLPRQAVAASTG
jgi:hypothetical protein